MQRNTNGIELEPEDLELLARIERETGKSIHQLTSEAIKSTYIMRYGSDREGGTALLEAIDKIGRQVQQVSAAVKRQRHEIALFSNSSKKDSQNSSKKDSQQSYPPPHSIYT